MEIRKYLNRINQIEKTIDNKMRSMERLKSIAYNITTSYGGEPVQSSGKKDKMADAISEIADIERENESSIKLLLQNYKAITETIEQLREDYFEEYDILTNIYVLGVGLEDYANTNGKSSKWAYSLHKRAIERMEEVLKCQK